jgi:histidinol dehydrogenase
VGTFIEGFVVLESRERELDVVGVYTAAGTSGGVSTLHMERVPGRLTQ